MLKSEIISILDHFNEYHICLNSEWIIENLKNMPENKSNIEHIFEQFCVQDISKSCDIKRPFKYKIYSMNDVSETLESPIVLQIVSTTNIGIPQNLQLDDINDSDSDESDDEKWENKYLDSSVMNDSESQRALKKQAEGNRMLKFCLTDGINQFQAVEIEKLTSLTVDVEAGTKVLIKPPCEIRRSIYFLNNSNTELIYFVNKTIEEKDIFSSVFSAEMCRTTSSFFSHNLSFIKQKQDDDKKKAKEKRLESKLLPVIQKLAEEELTIQSNDEEEKETKQKGQSKKQQKSKPKNTKKLGKVKDESNTPCFGVQNQDKTQNLSEDIAIEIQLGEEKKKRGRKKKELAKKKTAEDEDMEQEAEEMIDQEMY